MARCFFCFGDEKLTRAHLFHARIREALEIPDETVYLGSSSAATAGVVRAMSYGGDIRNAHVTSLCGPCNATWLQGIEIAAAPVFAEVVAGVRVPPPDELSALARWALVFGALSSELHPNIAIPEEHRRAIRSAAAMPDGYATYFVWTGDRLASVQMDLYRGVVRNAGGESVQWLSILHAGTAVVLSVTPGLVPRVARVLAEAGVGSALGFVGDSAVYVPAGWDDAMTTGPRPEHTSVHALGPVMLGGRGGFVPADNGQQLADLSGGLELTDTDLSFDFTGRLVDRRRLGPTGD